MSVQIILVVHQKAGGKKEVQAPSAPFRSFYLCVQCMKIKMSFKKSAVLLEVGWI